MLAGGRNSRCNPLDESPFSFLLCVSFLFVTPPPKCQLMVLNFFSRPGKFPDYFTKEFSANTIVAGTHAIVLYTLMGWLRCRLSPLGLARGRC